MRSFWKLGWKTIRGKNGLPWVVSKFHAAKKGEAVVSKGLLSFLLLREKACPHVNIFQMGRILACENFASQDANGGSGG